MEPALRRLEEVMMQMESVLVAFSGGVDSALVVWAAHRSLGDRAVALTAESPTLPAEEAALALALATDLGISHQIIHTAELEVEGYAQNAGDRCFFCKTELFALAEKKRTELGLNWVADGTILDDLGAHRPGLQAAADHRVRHPLVEAGLDKPTVRHLAKKMGIPVWDKPSFACLGSRFPVGTRVTRQKVERVSGLESVLRSLGVRQFRVRWHEMPEGVLARIEVAPSDIAALAVPELREKLVAAAANAGFKWVTLDLLGYGAQQPGWTKA